MVNSVSFKDGKKYRNSIAQHRQIREISDELCREYGKSVLENSSFYGGKSRGAYWAERQGHPTHREMLKKDMEYCLNTAFSWESFEKQLHGLGYTIDWKRMSVTGKGWDRAVRLNRLGYTEEVMQRRLDNNRHDNSFYAVVWNYNLPKKNKSRLLVQIAEELEFDLAHSHDVTEIYLDLLFLVLIRTLQALKAIKDAVIMSVELRHCVKDLTEYVHDYRFMQKNGLHTLSQLNSYIHDTQKQINELEHERGLLRNKIRHEKSPEVKAENRKQRQKITEHITPLRKDLKRAKRIIEQSPHLYELIKQEHALEIQARAKNRDYSR